MEESITLYHGSVKVIEKPVFGWKNPQNDYGLGFYCTENLELAKEWACSSEMNGYANEYTLNMDNLSVLSLTGGEYHILHWLYVLLKNRTFRIEGDVALQAKKYIDTHFSVNYEKYDIIKGHRADDSYFSFANAFLNNTISLSQLEKAMVLGKPGEQIVLLSERSFKALNFRGAALALNEIYYPRKLSRDTKARSEFQKEKAKGNLLTENYIIDIIREGWTDTDERLQRVILK